MGHLYSSLPYDPLHDFTPISLVGSSPNMLLVRTDSSLKSVADVLALARQKPGELSYGHAGKVIEYLDAWAGANRRQCHDRRIHCHRQRT